MLTTLNRIRAHGPCVGGWEKLLRHLGKTQADDEPLNIATILDSNGLDHLLSLEQNPLYRVFPLLESINGPGSWGKNPWVWVIEFRRVDA